MRPERLEMEGFTAFRERTVVDFDGADLFALTGPTGSGKSSVIDAVTFALYGSVPRHGKGAVAPVVSQGMLQARIRLDFSVKDDSYTVARVVRKDAKGRASTDEARLESGDQVIAGSAPEVTEAIEDLLGLDYEQFTTCVVLPQGEFERFLHAKPAERQGLLVALLGLDIYEKVARLAIDRQRLAEGRMVELETRRSQLEEASEDVIETVKARVENLQGLLTELDQVLPEISRIESEADKARESLGQLGENLERLGSLRLHEPATSESLIDARNRLEAATRASSEADLRLEEAEKHLADLPTRAALEAIAGDHARLAKERQALADCRIEAEAATRAQAEAVESLVGARAYLEDLQTRHAAAHMRSQLSVGDPCPVCKRPVAGLDTEPVSGDLESASKAVEVAERQAKEKDARMAGLEATRIALTERIEALVSDLTGKPGPEEVTDLLKAVDEQVDLIGELKEQHQQRRKEERTLRDLVDSLQETERRDRRQLQEARDRVAALSPPSLDYEDIAADYKRFREWVDETGERLRTRSEELTEMIRTLDSDRTDRLSVLEARCSAQGLGEGKLRDAVYEALVEASADLGRFESARAESQNLSNQLSAVSEQASVAKELARHLKANNFEKWMLDEALRVLARGANERLAELARGQYSLTLSDRLHFEVIDHHAADERRGIRSLSGGETFLVSLALALSLADHISEMSSFGGSRLEAIFLDEGFGTLDPETLETVASVISEIGASGKTVGLVTHVSELAAQVPVRFEVTKDATSARVRRLDWR